MVSQEAFINDEVYFVTYDVSNKEYEIRFGKVFRIELSDEGEFLYGINCINDKYYNFKRIYKTESKANLVKMSLEANIKIKEMFL